MLDVPGVCFGKLSFKSLSREHDPEIKLCRTLGNVSVRSRALLRR